MSKETIKTEELRLEGLHCADCAVTIEQTVAKLGGVEFVKANFTAGKVKIDYDPGQLGHDDLVRSVEKIGYKVSTETHKNLEKKQIWQAREFHFTLISGLLLGLGLGVQFFTTNQALFEFFGRSVTVSVFFYLTSMFFGAFYFSRQGWASIKNLRFNMNFLMSIAIIGAIIIEEYVEAASLAFLFSLAELLENYAVERARNSLRELMRLSPEEARIRRKNKEVALPVAEVRIGDVLLTRPGEKVALDGEVIAGASSVNQAPITGESVPVKKEVGDKVYAGSINVEGYLETRVTASSENSMLARIIHLVEDAENQKAPSERFVDRFAKIYTPAIIVLAVGVAVVPTLFFGALFNPWFIKALTLLVIACPCALVISTPVSVVSALTNASRNGILIKGGVYLEEMAGVKVIALDKTGTLTKGCLKVADVVPLNGLPNDELLRLAASLEIRSEHPIGKAIVESAGDAKLDEVQDFESIPGQGVLGNLGGKKYRVGRPELFKNLTDELPIKQMKALQKNGKTTMLVGTESEIIGIIGLLDEVRQGAIKTISKLKKAGKEVVMLTGDNEETARAIANQLNISHFHAALLPEEKVEEIKRLQEKYGKVAMVGDGVNDAPALAAASVGIAMGAAGTDAALETADIALMADDLTKLPYLVDLSKRARGVIRQNIFAAILIKLSLAVGVFPGLVSLVIAVLIGDMGASLGVTANAMRLARTNPEE